jgi:hypothetical protein
MSKLGKLLALPPAQLAALVEASVIAVAIELGLRLRAPGRLLATAPARTPRASCRRSVEPARLAWLVEIADRHLPGRPSCLRRALVLRRMLGRRGIAAHVRIGIARDDGRLLAHAWLETERGLSFEAADTWRPLLAPADPAPSSEAAR